MSILLKTDIALFLPSLAGGGAERVFIELSRLFSLRGLKVDMVVVRNEGAYRSQVPKTVRLIDLKKRKSWHAIPSLIRYLQEVRPRAILSALTPANLSLALAHQITGSSCRCILSERINVTLALSRESSAYDAQLTKIVGRIVYPWADGVVAISRGVAQSVATVFRLPGNQIKVIYNPVDQNQIGTLAKEPVSFPWPDSLPVILAVGRLHQQKDFPCLLRAFSRLRFRQGAHLVILGEGEERQRLEELAKQLGIWQDLWMPGFVKNPFAYMAKSDIFVLSSQWEGLGNVLIEAIALNIPVISTRCPSGPGEILENGCYGHLVPVGDEAALAAAMARGLTGDNPEYDREAALNRFEPEYVAEQYLEILLN